ncbi:hypothetical protein GCM10022255_034140 [Dactylosporangium darangshiense]|uniref:Uncharacterized protein n=1 Tax=Dactylosporangium darangshiense TaxID=579108 RepID=A0ABP8D7V7_9ACTN
MLSPDFDPHGDAGKHRKHKEEDRDRPDPCHAASVRGQLNAGAVADGRDDNTLHAAIQALGAAPLPR